SAADRGGLAAAVAATGPCAIVCRPQDLLECLVQAEARALEEELPGQERAVEGSGREALGRHSRPASCQDLPSVAMAGAITISTSCISAMVRAPSAAIDWRSAPTRFCVPWLVAAGPKRICSRGSSSPTRIRVPRGSVGEGAAIPQLMP